MTLPHCRIQMVPETQFALRDVTVSLEPGGFYGIMGPSGSGKSSLLYIFVCLEAADGGIRALRRLRVWPK